MVEQGFRLFPSHYAIWFARFYLTMYTGRATTALAMAEDVDARPHGIPDSDFDLLVLAARAVQSGAAADVTQAAAAQMAAGRAAAGQAENAIRFLSAVGLLDDAFAFADAYYFGRGFTVGELRFSRIQGTYTRRDDRRTHFLFDPPAARMRADPRFARLVGELGLARYWRESGSRPDYQRA